MHREWLLENADIVIKHNLTNEEQYIKSLLQNSEISNWLIKLSERSENNNIGDIHGSHDYRMENILGKCWILGLSKNIEFFSQKMNFILNFLKEHIESSPQLELSFGKIYHYRDYEKVLSSFLPLLGFFDDNSVKYIVKQRIDILFNFVKQDNYNIYVDGSKLKGVKKEWQPYIIVPSLYQDGHIALPDIHDLLLFAGMYKHLLDEEREKVEKIVELFFKPEYKNIIRRYGYFYTQGKNYNTKAVIFKLHLIDFNDMIFDKGDMVSLLFNVFVLSHFKSAKNSEWFNLALNYLSQYKNENNRYNFPSHLITEKSDSYVIFGGHMNVGENKKNKLYNELISTYWVEKIEQNLLS